MRYAPGTELRDEGPSQSASQPFSSGTTHSTQGSTSSSSRSQKPPSAERQKIWNKALEAKGYDRPARKEIIHELSSKPVNDRPEAFKKFVEADEAKRKDLGRKYGAKGRSRDERDKKAKRNGEEGRKKDKEKKRREVAQRLGQTQPREEDSRVSDRRAERLADGKYFQRPLEMSRENIPA